MGSKQENPMITKSGKEFGIEALILSFTSKI